jgi:diguanylate cyclase (GGDEF)-like protein
MMDRIPRILAIDDTPENLLTLGAALGADFDLQIATSGAMGVARAMESPPDLILLDVMMPEMDGYETCRRLQANPVTCDIPIIFVTAQYSPSDETRGLDAGAEDFIAKPINPSVLRARVRTHLTIKRQADLLRSMAYIDGLTGIANRRQFDDALESEWRGCRRTCSPLTLAMIDIDHFKQFNDAYGHLAGDACLKTVAAALKAAMGRSRDLIARYGGEEFICLLPDTDRAGAQIKTEELRQSVQSLNLPHKTSRVAPVVTVSIGVTTMIPVADLTSDGLIAAADIQLYEAKRSGRNRICSIELQEIMT